MAKIDARDKNIKGVLFEVGGNMKVEDSEILTDKDAVVGVNVRGNYESRNSKIMQDSSGAATKNPEKGIDWNKWATIATIVGVIVAVAIAIIGWLYFGQLPSDRPFLDFGSDKVSVIWISNISNYPAINPQLFLKRDNTWFISNLKLASAISPGMKVSAFRLENGTYDRNDPNLKLVDSKFLENNPRARKIIAILDGDTTFTSGALVIYESLSGNVYFTSSGNSEGNSLGTGKTD